MTVPTSTYRLQLGPEQTFDQARALVDYLRDLGVGALYVSPVLTAVPGSTHGYDMVDPTRAAPVLGGESARKALADRLRDRGLGLVVDVVPNHMGVAVPAANPWWWEVLREGSAAVHADYFDIDFSRGPILLPVLADDGDGGAAALADLRVADGVLRYHEHEFPLAEGTAATPDGATPAAAAAAVHERQHYRLVSWRRGGAELTYRRFFDISTLAAIRVEDPTVFAATHGELLRWVEEGEVTGLRIDHPDGLADPGEYLRRLREAAPDAWLVVEKILAPAESLPASWPVDGTTGYEVLREVCGLFVDPAGEAPLTALAQELSAPESAAACADPHGTESACKHFAAAEVLGAELDRIAGLVTTLPVCPDRETARSAALELLRSFPVYRSYLPEGRAALDEAVVVARAHRPELGSVIDAIAEEMTARPREELATRVQQTSGMVTAKGVEDTAYYRFNRFVALNEVGGDPARFGVSPAEFHAAAQGRAAGLPTTMTSLSTHDTKRSEDVRARLAVLSELPSEWGDALRRWTARHPLPEASLNLLGWQCLLGAWPIGEDRLRDYLAKAAKEAKLGTSWTAPDADFDAAVAAWPGAVLGDERTVAEIAAFAERVTGPGWSNSLGQKLIQTAGPGVPDVYQGTELWDLSLVDPDNRRPVDFDARRDLLARLDQGFRPEVDRSGAAKLLVTSRVLRLRRDEPELFTGYRPLTADGPAARHAVAFARGGRHAALVAVATRLPVGLANSGGWRDTILAMPDGRASWIDVISGERVDAAAPLLGDVLARYPVALLRRD
ncbi:(1-_4)-alpha-D-glucan 1-alpha-D-glucosylmutase [Actinoalloteichus hoggarensis]|uniref:Maltooligosyl trehalose synthase n=1 Tax=Actinoalloteichus hoggarensis TaxID=1470176 RepID=A0A221W626_9PSEU|nr:malto-oligosyltrehalose synthase [Actinoalloteichus hoggarensis]ASO21370.1 Maltooligosyl trehalose synthase [Actinoalloteichus hoggarensis]MBB5921303.1 (1->4)-alpha-D-glucan 1-alpha-D-glucosylmutase [Actinoalloteichus hoggarensis]